jgi:hypothetical protein
MILTLFTLAHVVISLIGIVSGAVVLVGLLHAQRLDGWTKLFLTTTVLTSVTGYFFPVHRLMPSHIVGAVSLVVLGFAIYARYSRRMAGPWRTVYIVCAVTALYLNVFVAIVQAFLKIHALHMLAPTQTEAPFRTVQVVVLALFLVLGAAARTLFTEESAKSPMVIS